MGKATPLMANMVEGGRTPVLPASELQALGFAFVRSRGASMNSMSAPASR
jgi:2-methylisocitrate lyase-like PEP mutase family enzyme